MIHAASEERQHALTRMILIDSYAAGRITEVPFDGGTVLTGRNGRGKTTLLQITPLFHGESPWRLSIKTEGRDSFARHYLPNSTSYIIFEYVRAPGEYRMAVVYAQKDDHLAWRFIRSGYRPEFFLDDKDNIVEGRDLLYHLKPMGVEVTRQITSQTEYRNILHNTPDRKSDQRALAADFSIMPRSKSMRGVERIVSGMFARQTSFSDLQNIIVSDIREGEDNISLMADRTQAEEWVKDHAAYKAVMAYKPEFEACEASAQAMRIARTEIEESAERLSAYIIYNDNRRNKISQRLAEIKQSESDIDDIEATDLREIVKNIGNEKDELDRLKTQSSEYQRQDSYYADQDVEGKKDRVRDLPEVEKKKRLAIARRDALTGTNDEIRTKHENLLSEIAKEEQSTTHQINEAQEAERVSLEADRHREEDALRQNNKSEVDRARKNEADARENLSKIKILIVHREADIKSVQASDSTEEAYNQAVIEYDRAKDQFTIATELHSKCRHEATKAKDRYDARERNLNDLQIRAESILSDLEQAKEFVEGRPGSLLRLLRREREDLVDPLSRMLNPEALLSKELGAEFLDEGNTLYGFKINHEPLAPHPSADPVLAGKRVEEKDQLYKGTLAFQREAESELKSAAEDLSAAKEAETESYHALNVSARKRDAAREILESSLAIRESERESIKQQIESELETLKAKASVAQKALEESISALTMIDEKVDASVSELSAHYRKKQIEMADAYKQRHARNRASAQAKRTQAKDILDRNLETQGVDIESLRKAEEEVLEISDALASINEDLKIVEAFQRWKESEALPQAKRRKRIGDLEASIPSLESKRDQIRAEIQRSRDILSKEKSSLREEDNSLTAPRGQAQERLSAITEGFGIRPNSNIPWRNDENLHLVIERLNRSQVHYRRAAADIKRTMEILNSAFGSYPGSQVHQFKFGGRFESEAKGSPLRGYSAWYSHVHDDTRRTMAGIGRQIAQAVGDFYDQLKQFEGSASKFNRELQQHLGEATRFEGVTDLEIRVVSTISELDYWKRIEKVADLASSWRRHAEDSSPIHEEAFVESLASLLEMWSISGSVRAELQQHIRSEGNVTENGTKKNFRNASQLVAISSNGLSYLILVSIFIAFLNRIRRGSGVTITWALDELRDIDRTNTRVLMNLLRRNNIELFTAFPDPDPDIMSLFKHRFMIGEERRLMRVKSDPVEGGDINVA